MLPKLYIYIYSYKVRAAALNAIRRIKSSQLKHQHICRECAFHNFVFLVNIDMI